MCVCGSSDTSSDACPWARDHLCHWSSHALAQPGCTAWPQVVLASFYICQSPIQRPPCTLAHFASGLGAVIFQSEKRNKKFRIFASFVFTPTIFFFFGAVFSCACCTVLLPCFATRWLRNEEQRPLKSGRGEKQKEAENWKSRRNPRSEQSPKALITHDFWLSYEPRTDILLVWSCVCVWCVWCACHIQTHTGWFISLIWIKARERPLCVGPSPCYLTHVKRGVRHLCPEEDCWVWM